jgi:hypothetical protein
MRAVRSLLRVRGCLKSLIQRLSRSPMNRSLPAGTRRPLEWDNVVLSDQYILD